MLGAMRGAELDGRTTALPEKLLRRPRAAERRGGGDGGPGKALRIGGDGGGDLSDSDESAARSPRATVITV